eukprot:gene30768-biopygen62499
MSAPRPPRGGAARDSTDSDRDGDVLVLDVGAPGGAAVSAARGRAARRPRGRHRAASSRCAW